MPKDDSQQDVRHDEPTMPPEHSLPSYSEPTPETHAKLSREEEAELALKNTRFTPGTPMLLMALFLVTIISVPILQFIVEAGGARHLQLLDIFKTLPSAQRIAATRSVADAWHLLPRVEDIKAYENALEDDSVVSQRLLPHVQSLLTSPLGAGNEQAYTGREGWLFYRPDVDYVIGPPFLGAAWMKHRAHAANVAPDAIRAIVDFRDQLAAREIKLVIMPMPVKPTIDGHMLSARGGETAALQNPSFGEFKSRLEKHGVQLFDPVPLLMERKRASGGEPQYLETDTHWRPDAMEYVARELAAVIGPTTAVAGDYKLQSQNISSLGDIATMLKLPPTQDIYKAQTVKLDQVLTGNVLWRASKDADVLLLGDSFANIFSLEAMGWGEAAGLAEHLSYALRRPVDAILRNSDASFATREILSRELAKGHDRLAGKKWVVWEFAARELSFGNWKLLDMKRGQAQPTRFITLKPAETMTVTGTVEAVSAVPRPGSVPYKDHIFTVQLTDLSGVNGPIEGGQILVYLWSMKDNQWTSNARLRVGDKLSVRLRPWADVEATFGKINRSDIEDAALQLEEPAWGESIEAPRQ